MDAPQSKPVASTVEKQKQKTIPPKKTRTNVLPDSTSASSSDIRTSAGCKPIQSTWLSSAADTYTEPPIIPVYTKISARLLNNLTNDSAEPMAVAMVRQNWNGLDIEGAKLLGRFSVNPAKQDRLLIDFQTLVLANGTEVPISAYAEDSSDGQIGLKAKVDSHVGATILKILGQTAGAVISLATYDQTRGVSGKVYDATAGQALNNLPVDSISMVGEATDFRLVFRKSVSSKKGFL